MTKSDWIAPERHIKIVDMILTVGFLICLASYPPTAPEIKFGEAILLFMVIFEAPVHMLPSIFNGDANAVC
jgi:hypothetical protein